MLLDSYKFENHDTWEKHKWDSFKVLFVARVGDKQVKKDFFRERFVVGSPCCYIVCLDRRPNFAILLQGLSKPLFSFSKFLHIHAVFRNFVGSEELWVKNANKNIFFVVEHPLKASKKKLFFQKVFHQSFDTTALRNKQPHRLQSSNATWKSLQNHVNFNSECQKFVLTSKKVLTRFSTPLLKLLFTSASF